MKYVFTLMIGLIGFLGSAQETECNYKVQVETDEEVFKLTNEELTEFLVGRDRNVFIYFSLMRENEVRSLVLQVSVNAKEMPPILCFNESSRVSFKLEDGSFVSLRYLGEVNCGRQTENVDTLNNSTSEAAFLLDDSSAARLAEVKLASMRITTMKTNFDITFQEVISNSQIPTPIYPKEFFLNYLECLE